MALTQVSSEGIKDDAIKDVKIPANAVGNAELKDDAVGVNELSATGTPSSSTFLRGDNTWTAPVSHSIGDGGLTTNDFTDADHTKLDGIETNATADQTGGEIKTLYEAQTNTNAFTDADHTKLDGIATSANNYVHPNHSGEVTSTADGATVIASNIVDEDNLKISNSPSNGTFLQYKDGTDELTWATPTDTNTTYTAGTGLNLSGTEFSVTSLALTTVQEAANESAMLGLTTQEGDVVVRTDENKSYVKNAGTAGSMSDFTLLRTPTDAVLSINGNTGAISAAQIASAVEAASDSNTFTDADHTKLNAIEASATADQTGAEIKAAYEGESDTNAFTDADHTKLDGIAAGAEVNVQSDWNSSSGDNQILNKPTLVSALNDLSDVSASSPSADQIIKWNGSAWALAADGGSAAGGVSQNLIVTLSESIDGSRTDFSMSTTPATAQNLTVSINGVIQKPNAGTTISNSSQGYCVSGSTLKFATAPANGSTVFVVAQTAASGGSTDLEFNDNAKVKLGTGDDLQIYHDGTYSHIQNLTGDLLIKNDGTNPIRIRSVYNEENIVCYANGSVEIYYDNSKKLETNGSGVQVFGHIYLDDSNELKIGSGADLKIYHDASNSWVKNSTNTLILASDLLELKNGAGDETYLKGTANGAVELYHDGDKRLSTWSDGVNIYGDEGEDALLHLYADDGDDSPDKWRLRSSIYGSGHFQFYDGSNWDDSLKAVNAGTTELFYDGSKKLETTSTGAKVHGALTTTADLNFNTHDNQIIKLGASSDLQIFHNGTHSYIDEVGNGNLVLRTNQTGTYATVVIQAGSENSILAHKNGNVEIYYDSSKKLETTTNGIQMTGDIRFNNSTWTGETDDGKIQTHGDHMYFQTAGSSWFFRKNDGTTAASIANNGTYSTSDITLKKDVVTISNSVDTIKQLTGRSFTWKDDNVKSFGVIAQEVETILPELVTSTEEPDGSTVEPKKMVNYPAFTGHFIEAIKELVTKIETLETKVAALEAK